MAEIKRIQLRGISRTPSDRLTDDGGCAESLNVQLDNTEVAPAMHPDVSDIGIPEGVSYDFIFVHKTRYIKTYIVCDSTMIGYYKDGTFSSIIELDGESVRDITSVGNTIIVATDKGMKYILFSEGTYKYLGDSIPMPTVRFESAHYYNGDLNTPMGSISLYENADGPILDSIRGLNEELWLQAADDIDAGKSNKNTEEMLAVQQEVWAKINSKALDIKRDGAFVYPVLARYAVRLFDGSYVYQSVPVLLGAGHEKFARIRGHHNWIEGGQSYATITMEFLCAYTSKLYMTYFNVGSWTDIVKSVDVFLSTDICYPYSNAMLKSLAIVKDDSGTLEGSSKEYAYRDYEIEFKNGGLSDFDAVRSEITSKANFYKIASFAIEDIYNKANGYDIGKQMRNINQDELLVKDRLPDYENSFVRIAPAKVYNMNNKVFAIGDLRSIPVGYNQLQSSNIIWKKFPDEEYQKYAFAYYVRDTLGKEHKVYFPYYVNTYMVNGENSRPYGLVFHPDSRCRKMQILHEGAVYEVSMNPHPSLNCSYGYWGLDKQVTDLTPVREGVTDDEFFSEENEMEMDERRIYTTPVNNPFHFTIAGTLSFSSDVIGIATAMKPMSEGQFGQFPLYIFTSDGIWTKKIADDGDFLPTSNLISQDVCINPDSITPIDNAVIFVSAQGVMLLHKSQVVNISPYMNGRHYVIENSAETIIRGQEFFSNLIPSLSDTTPFLAFVKEASVAYDYPGKRLIFLKKDEKYQYIYKLDTQTWHKAAHGVNLIAPINSYPECLIQADEGGYTKVYDFTTLLDAAQSEISTRGVIATRPFDLGEPDILKTITDVRIRGQFEKGAVKFILLGSNDGFNFQTINTLRGRAWKLFRIIILADLKPTERISWIDVAYDRKFTNRLR